MLTLKTYMKKNMSICFNIKMAEMSELMATEDMLSSFSVGRIFVLSNAI